MQLNKDEVHNLMKYARLDDNDEDTEQLTYMINSALATLSVLDEFDGDREPTIFFTEGKDND